MFNLTKDGWLQPPPAVTKHVHAPILEFKEKLDQSINRELRQNMKQFLTDFQKNPEKLIEIFKERYYSSGTFNSILDIIKTALPKKK